jgi:hypothetical protein
MCNKCIVDLDVEVFIVFLKYSTGDLGSVVSDGPIWDPEPADN